MGRADKTELFEQLETKWRDRVHDYLHKTTRIGGETKLELLTALQESLTSRDFLDYIQKRRLSYLVRKDLNNIVRNTYGGSNQTRARRFNISPMPRMNTRRRSFTPDQLDLITLPHTELALDTIPHTPPDQRTVPFADAAPRRAIYVRRAVFADAVDAVVDDMEAYTELDREELKESFLRVAKELEEEGRFEMRFGSNKENYESNLKKVVEEIDLVELGKKAVQGAAMDKVLRKALNMV